MRRGYVQTVTKMKKKKMLSKRKRRDTCKTDFKIVFNQSSSSNKNLTNLKKLSHNSEEKQSSKCSRIATVIPPLEQGLLGPPRPCGLLPPRTANILKPRATEGAKHTTSKMMMQNSTSISRWNNPTQMKSENKNFIL